MLPEGWLQIRGGFMQGVSPSRSSSTGNVIQHKGLWRPQPCVCQRHGRLCRLRAHSPARPEFILREDQCCSTSDLLFLLLRAVLCGRMSEQVLKGSSYWHLLPECTHFLRRCGSHEMPKSGTPEAPNPRSGPGGQSPNYGRIASCSLT